MKKQELQCLNFQENRVLFFQKLKSGNILNFLSLISRKIDLIISKQLRKVNKYTVYEIATNNKFA